MYFVHIINQRSKRKITKGILEILEDVKVFTKIQKRKDRAEEIVVFEKIKSNVYKICSEMEREI